LVVVTSYVITIALLTTAVDASAMLPAAVVVKSPVGMSVIDPPPDAMGAGGVMVTTAAVPLINTMGVVGEMVAALAMVGAAADVAVTPDTIGVVRVGVVAKTAEPVPVSSVSAVRKLADDGVVKNVATLVPRPDTPVAIGKPVQFASVPEVGVPSAGVTSVGDVNVPPENVPPVTAGVVTVGVVNGALVNIDVAVICLVMAPWTMTWTSVPALEEATGSAVIVTVAIRSFLRKC
jgi:hypothetical protein